MVKVGNDWMNCYFVTLIDVVCSWIQWNALVNCLVKVRALCKDAWHRLQFNELISSIMSFMCCGTLQSIIILIQRINIVYILNNILSVVLYHTKHRKYKTVFYYSKQMLARWCISSQLSLLRAWIQTVIRLHS